MPMVAHILHHLVHYCRQHGPLWTFWCYPFEKMLAFVKLSTHGTSAVENQFAFYAALLECLPILEQKVCEFNQVPSQRMAMVIDYIKSVNSFVQSDAEDVTENFTDVNGNSLTTLGVGMTIRQGALRAELLQNTALPFLFAQYIVYSHFISHNTHLVCFYIGLHQGLMSVPVSSKSIVGLSFVGLSTTHRHGDMVLHRALFISGMLIPSHTSCLHNLDLLTSSLVSSMSISQGSVIWWQRSPHIMLCCSTRSHCCSLSSSLHLLAQAIYWLLPLMDKQHASQIHTSTQFLSLDRL